LAKAIQHEGRSEATTVTHPGRLMGTPAYMSPEQIRGKPADHRADIWAFGCILYEMLAGQRPFEGETVSDTIALTLEREPDWGLLPQRVPERMRVLIRRCLEKNPQKRLQHVNDAALEISDSLNLPVIRTQHRWAKAIGAVAVLAVAAVLLVHPPWRRATRYQASEKTLVVLPFENLGPVDDDAFVSGVTGAITARLAGVHGLAVIARPSALQYDGKERNVKRIGQELGVDYILDGTVERERPTDLRSRLRVIPTLVRVSDSKHMWAETYDSDMTDVFRVQSDLAERVAQALDITVLDQEREFLRAQSTENLEAYDYYLRGNAYMERGCYQEENALFAVQMYQKAVELDPQFTLAHAMLTEAHLATYFHRHDHTEARLALAKQAVDTAVSLAPDLPEVHKALGIYYYWGLLDYDRALQECAIALKSRPNDSILFVFAGAVQRRQGKWDEALVNFEKAAKLDPRSSLSAQCLADTAAVLRDYPQANRHFQRVISLSPDLTNTYARYIKTLLSWHGDTQAARNAFSQARKHVDLHKDDLLAYHAILLDIFEGNFAAAREFLSAHEAPVLETQFFYIPKAQLHAQIHQLEGDHQLAQESYDSARTLLEAQIEERPRDALLRSALGIAYAGLRRKDDAMREGRLAVELLPVTKEAWAGLWRLEDLARIYVMVGEFDLAIDGVEYLVQRPGELSAPLLGLDPTWTPLRNHPRFRNLLQTSD
jgi:serine/threonine-protein kinase